MFFSKSVLYVVGVPIGNIFDFSCRAIFVLKNVDFIIAEDSRKICFLLSFFNFRNKVLSVTSFNEKFICEFIINKLKNNFSAAILSDAGTPGISDPGNFFVNSIYEHGFKVISVPGPSVISAVVSISRLYFNSFIFDGFLPKKNIYKKIFFNKILYEKRACIFFEAAERLLETFLLMKDVLDPNRFVFLAKDLTKKFEAVYFFRLCEIESVFLNSSIFIFKGEFVILLSGDNSKCLYKNDINNFLFYNLFINDEFFKSIYFSSIFYNNKFINLFS